MGKNTQENFSDPCFKSPNYPSALRYTYFRVKDEKN